MTATLQEPMDLVCALRSLKCDFQPQLTASVPPRPRNVQHCRVPKDFKDSFSERAALRRMCFLSVVPLKL
jgi:hypothetical protein